MVFATLLAGHRTFRGVSAAELPDVAAALRARRDYPALFMALEHATVRRSRTYAAAARHAALLSRIDDVERSLTAVRQFQGAVALTLNARVADTLTAAAADTLIESLAAVTLVDGRYDGRIVEWLVQHWLPAVRQGLRARDGLSAEQTVAAALAGPANMPLPTVQWEGHAYMVDPAGAMRQRLLEIRARQRGVPLDTVIALYQAARARANLDAFVPQLQSFTAADEYQGDALDPAEALTRADTMRVVDFLTAHVLPSWAYAPYLGTPDRGALVGGDGSLRHRLGVRLMGRDRLQLRWQIPMSPAARGSMQGSIVGVQTGLATWSLRRLASDAVPAAPAIDSNDTMPLTLTAALINPRRLTDADLSHLAAVQAKGTEAVLQARTDPARLDVLASTAALSPWTRAILPWIAREEPERVDDQFSPTERARLGGLKDVELAAWGSVWMPSGSLTPRIPRDRFHELYAGRTTDGIVGGRSIDVVLRIAAYLSELKLPASLAAPVLQFAMRDHLDRVRPFHAADADAFARQARTLTRTQVEDYVGALPAIGPLRLVAAMIRIIAVALIALVGGVHGTAQGQLQLQIVSPPEGAYVSDRLTLEARILPRERRREVLDVTFFADGRQVCRSTDVEAPKCSWDAGPIFKPHVIRVVATTTSGERLVATTTTREVDFKEGVNVRVVQVNASVADRGGRFVGGLTRDQFRDC